MGDNCEAGRLKEKKKEESSRERERKKEIERRGW
jgi:hypothetical protein